MDRLPRRAFCKRLVSSRLTSFPVAAAFFRSSPSTVSVDSSPKPLKLGDLDRDLEWAGCSELLCPWTSVSSAKYATRPDELNPAIKLCNLSAADTFVSATSLLRLEAYSFAPRVCDRGGCAAFVSSELYSLNPELFGSICGSD